MQDPIADMLTRIRNAYASHLATTSVPYSKVKEELAKLLKGRGLVSEVKIDKDEFKIDLALKYENGQPAVNHIRRISRPGLRVYHKSKSIRRIRGGLGLVVISTSKGLMTGDEARKNKLGGEVIAEVW